MMNLFKRIISGCLVLCMLLFQFPVLAAAEETDGGWGTPNGWGTPGNWFENSGTSSIFDQVPSFGVTSMFAAARSGGAITSLTVGCVDALANPQGEGYSFDAETATLTLNGFRYENHEDTLGIHCIGDLTILLQGENHIDVSVTEFGNNGGILVEGALTIQGDPNGTDSLTVIADNQMAAILAETLSVENCDSIAAAATALGACGNSQLNISNSSVTANTAPFEKYCELGMLDVFPAVGSMGSVSIHASTIHVEAGLQGIYGQNTEIVGGSTVNSQAEAFPIMCANNLSIIDSQVDVLNTTTEEKFGRFFEVSGFPFVSAIYLNGSTIDDVLLIQNSRVTAKSLYIATMSMNTAIVDGSTVSIEAGHIGIYSEHNTFVENSTVTASNTFSIQQSMDYSMAVQLNIPPAAMLVFDGNGAIQITGSNVTVPQGNYGVTASNFVAANSSLDIRNCFAAVYANNSAEISDCSSVYLVSSREVADEYIAAGGQGDWPLAIFAAAGPIVIENCPDVTLSGVMAAVCANGDNVTISNSHIDSDGGILAAKNLEIADSTVQANAEQTKEDVMLGCVPVALDGEASMYITHSEVVATGSIAGLWNNGGVIQIKDSTVEASASWTAEEAAEVGIIGPASAASAGGRIVLWDAVTTSGETVGNYSWLDTECATFLDSNGVPPLSVTIIPGETPDPEPTDPSEPQPSEPQPTAPSEPQPTEPSEPQPSDPENVCGENLTWIFDQSTNTLTISGEGDMYDFDSVDAPWKEYRSEIRHVILEEGVTSIGKYAFYECTNLTKVTIPSSLRRCAFQAFGGCTAMSDVCISDLAAWCRISFDSSHPMFNSGNGNLYLNGELVEMLVLPDANLSSVRQESFMNFGCLKSVVIPEGISMIYTESFQGCSNLESVVLPDSLKQIGLRAFYACSNLKEIQIPEHVTKIDVSTFSSCTSLTSITIPDSVIELREFALSGCDNLETVTLSKNLTSITNGLLSQCPKLSKIVLPDGIVTIGFQSFVDCTNLREITIPGTVTEIAERAFGECENLSDVFFGGTEAQWNEITIGNYNECLLNANIHFEEEGPAIIASGTFGETAQWKLYSDGSMIISGTGRIEDHDVPYASEELVKTIVIEEGITEIGEYALSDFDMAHQITLPDSVTLIDNGAFDYCRSLVSLNISANVTSIYTGSAFTHCAQLTGIWVDEDNAYYTSDANGVLYNKDMTQVLKAPAKLAGEYVISAGVKEIGQSAFSGCENITAITIPESVTRFHYSAFYGCKSLESLSIPKNVKDIYPFALDDLLSLTGIWVDEENTAFSNDENGVLFNKNKTVLLRAPASMPVASYAVPQGTEKIDNDAFENCANLCSVDIPDTVTELGSDAFSSCGKLKNVHFDGSAPSIGYAAFRYVTATADYPANDPSWTEEVRQNYEGAIIWVPYGDVHEHTEVIDAAVEPTCTETGLTEGKHCSECGEVLVAQEEIPALGHSYENGICTVCGEADPDYSTAVKIASGWSGDLTWVLTDDGVLTFSGTGAMKNYGYKSEMPWYKYIDQITSVVINEGVTRIGDYAFYGMTKLETIDIAETVTYIGDFSFKGSTALDGVVLPPNLSNLGTSAFYGCTGLTSIEIPASLYTVKPYAFKNCSSLAEVTFHEGNLMKLSDGSFYGTALTEVEFPKCLDIIDVYCFKNCFDLATITIPEGDLTQIREAVFYGTAIPSITIPEGVTKVGPYAFKNCVNLKSVNLPTTLTSVGEASFYACTGLQGITIPDAVTSIGDYAFRKCAAMTEVNLGRDLTDIGLCAFYGCSGLTELEIPDKVTTIQGYAFKGCTGLTSVNLGSSVETLGESAFHTCTGLKTLELPKTLKSIGDYCFSGSYNLWQLTFTGNAPSIGSGAFKSLAATAYYPANDSTWTSDVMQNYGGSITWKAAD